MKFLAGIAGYNIKLFGHIINKYPSILKSENKFGATTLITASTLSDRYIFLKILIESGSEINKTTVKANGSFRAGLTALSSCLLCYEHDLIKDHLGRPMHPTSQMIPYIQLFDSRVKLLLTYGAIPTPDICAHGQMVIRLLQKEIADDKEVLLSKIKQAFITTTGGHIIPETGLEALIRDYAYDISIF